MTSAPVTVIVPTHDHPTTLPYAVRSVLEQTFGDLDVVVIGDGVSDDTRDAVGDLQAQDARVTFVDRPKSPRHAEAVRHEVLAGVTSPVIGYQGDDDLLLPHHLATMLDVLEGRDFAHPLPLLFVSTSDDPVCFPMDLADPRWVQAQAIDSNHISLTGVVHTLAAYRRLPHGWRQTPDDNTTDNYMWLQFFEQPWFAGATAPHATTIKLPTRSRSAVGHAERGDEIGAWWARMHEPGFAAQWREIEDRAVRAAAVRSAIAEVELRDEVTRRMLRQWDVRLGELRRRLTSHLPALPPRGRQG